MPDAPWIKNIADQVNQQFGTTMTPGDIRSSPLSLAAARGQVTPMEMSDMLQARVKNPGIPNFDPTQPTAQMMQQAGIGSQPAQIANVGPVEGPTPARTPLNVVPSSGASIPVGPVSTPAAPATPALASAPTESLASMAASEEMAAGQAAAAKALSGAVATETAAGATGAGAATASTAAKGGKLLSGINTRLNALAPGLGMEITASSLMSGLSVAGLGLMASGMIDRLNIGGEGSNWDVGISKGIMGAGLGAGGAIALGLSAGPIGWAALGGAALFSLTGIFGPHQSEQSKANKMTDKALATINNLIARPEFGIDSYTGQQIRAQFYAATEIYKGNKDWKGLETYIQGLAQTVPTFLMQAAEKNQAVQQRMKLQAAFGPVYADMMARSADANKLAFDTQMQAASQVSDPKISAALQSRAAEGYRSSQELQAAYARQIAASTTNLPPAAQQVQDQAQQAIYQMMGQA